MRPFDLDVVRLSLHVLAATVWVGGQVTLMALLPTLRGLDAAAPRAAARAFNRVAWGAFAVLVLTGIWHLAEVDVADRSTGYQVALMAKLGAVAASGIGAAVHAGTTSKVALAVGGALSLFAAIAAVVLGVWLHG